MNTSKEDEGYIDAQTATGKVPSGIAKAAENAEHVFRMIKAVKDYTQEKNKKRGILL